MAETFQPTARRWADLLADALQPIAPFAPVAESDDRIQVERGAAYASLVLDKSSLAPVQSIGRMLDMARYGAITYAAVVDRAGQSRAPYRPLLVYSALQSYALAYETLSAGEFGRWEEGLRPWCDLLESRLADAQWWQPAAAPSHVPGAATTASEACLSGLALHVAGKIFVRDAWTDLAAAVFGQLTQLSDGPGPILPLREGQNPEAWWFEELATLHAAASYAAQAEDKAVARLVARATSYHHQNTQTDHATSQPWGLFAFAWNTQTASVAEGMLHAARTNSPQGLDGVALMLLADALYCLRLFLPGTGA